MDKNQLRYDLALAYAQAKLLHALNNETIQNNSEIIPDCVIEQHYLMDSFNAAFGEYNNLKDSCFSDFV